MVSSALKVDNNISYKTFRVIPQISGTALALLLLFVSKKLSSPVLPVTNLPPSVKPVVLDWQNPKDWEIMKLRRDVAELTAQVRERNDKLAYALSVLLDQFQFWNDFLHGGVGESRDHVNARMIRLRAALDRLIDPAPTRHFSQDIHTELFGKSGGEKK